MTEPLLRVFGLLPESHVNGPGRRAVVHLQGCTLGCPGCFNPESHAPLGGTTMTVDAVCDALLASRPDGVTISGGEPFQQPEALLALVTRLRARGVASLLVFSGYALDELEQLPLGPSILERIDVVVAGRYDVKLPGGGLLGSGNQRLVRLTDRHGLDELSGDGLVAELTIRPDGTVILTGFPSAELRRAVRELSG